MKPNGSGRAACISNGKRLMLTCPCRFAHASYRWKVRRSVPRQQPRRSMRPCAAAMAGSPSSQRPPGSAYCPLWVRKSRPRLVRRNAVRPYPFARFGNRHSHSAGTVAEGAARGCSSAPGRSVSSNSRRRRARSGESSILEPTDNAQNSQAHLKARTRKAPGLMQRSKTPSFDHLVGLRCHPLRGTVWNA